MNLPIHNVRPGILRSSQKFSCEVFGSVEDGHEMQHGNHNDQFQFPMGNYKNPLLTRFSVLANGAFDSNIQLISKK